MSWFSGSWEEAHDPSGNPRACVLCLSHQCHTRPSRSTVICPGINFFCQLAMGRCDALGASPGCRPSVVRLSHFPGANACWLRLTSFKHLVVALWMMELFVISHPLPCESCVFSKVHRKDSSWTVAKALRKSMVKS